jgi:hypothetical protein
MAESLNPFDIIKVKFEACVIRLVSESIVRADSVLLIPVVAIFLIFFCLMCILPL